MENSKFTLSYYELKSELDTFFDNYKKKLSFQIPLGIFVSFSLVFFTSSFKPVLGIGKSQVEVAFYILWALVVVWLLKDLVKYMRVPEKSVDAFCTHLMENAINNKIEPTCLFIIKRYDRTSRSSKILCFWHVKSGCYYLPYVLYNKKLPISRQINDIKTLLAHHLGVPEESISIEYHQKLDMWYQRFIERKNAIITYDNKVFSIVIDAFDKCEGLMENFTKNGRDFKWLTLEEFKDHQATAQKNLNVIQLLERNNTLVLKTGNSFECDPQ